jgi:tyrosyl-DNA phosphodiesterase-1
MDSGRGAKRRRIGDDSNVLRNVSISPPPKRVTSTMKQHLGGPSSSLKDAGRAKDVELLPDNVTNVPARTNVISPVQLNFVEELPAASNVDTVSLGSILGDPMIKECWLFNYLFDMDFVMCDYNY